MFFKLNLKRISDTHKQPQLRLKVTSHPDVPGFKCAFRTGGPLLLVVKCGSTIQKKGQLVGT